jgi:hypothetical protein
MSHADGNVKDIARDKDRLGAFGYVIAESVPQQDLAQAVKSFSLLLVIMVAALAAFFEIEDFSAIAVCIVDYLLKSPALFYLVHALG